MEWRFEITMSPAGRAHLRNLLADPRARATVSRIINQESHKMLVEARALSYEELHESPAGRRRWGSGYHQSWQTIPAHMIGIDRLEGGFENDHPAARIIEHGSRDHVIPGNPKLAFPWDGQPSGARSGPGQKGEFTLTTGGDARLRAFPEVHHPGTRPHHIARRAVDRYRARWGNVLNR